MVRNAMKTGTKPGLNQISANKISDITGMERTVTSIGVMNALNPGLSPARIPVARPKMPDTKKPVIPRKTVLPATIRKSGSVNKPITVMKVSSGCGIINGELK
jgi:hypothetical protein